MSGAFGSIVDAELLPRLVRIEENLTAASFFQLKLVPAEYVLRRAREEGQLAPGALIVESTSGSFGYALALVARVHGYRLTIVSDSVIDQRLRARLEELGAQVDIVREPLPSGGIQAARLARVEEILAANPHAYWPRQYENPWNALAYERVADHLVDTLGTIDCLIGTVGTGGSMCGLGRRMRARLPRLRLIGVDTHGSVVFGQLDRARKLRGLGNSIVPQLVEHDLFDEVHWVTAAEAFHTTRELHARVGMFRGPTSGAAYLVADWWARRNPGQRAVVIFPDEGHRYDADVHDAAWLQREGLMLERRPEDPATIEHPRAAEARWTRLAWGRRRLAEVLRG